MTCQSNGGSPMIRQEPTEPVVRNGGARRASFTLTELLVVISIISVLAALLMPALKNAREQARRMKCMSNLRQITLAMITYVGDNEGRFPHYHGTCCYDLCPYLGIKPNTNPGFLSTAHVFYCPGSAGKPVITGDGGAGYDLGGAFNFVGGLRYQSYGFNNFLTPGGGLSNVSRIDQVSYPAKVFWAVDSTSSRFDIANEDFVPAYRHGGRGDIPAPHVITDPTWKSGGAGFNASFVDGHVEWVPFAKYWAWRDRCIWVEGGYSTKGTFAWF